MNLSPIPKIYTFVHVTICLICTHVIHPIKYQLSAKPFTYQILKSLSNPQRTSSLPLLSLLARLSPMPTVNSIAPIGTSSHWVLPESFGHCLPRMNQTKPFLETSKRKEHSEILLFEATHPQRGSIIDKSGV